MKSPSIGTPFSIHLDFGLAERAHNVRISLSNLYKSFTAQNGFVIQIPLDYLHSDRWTVLCLDVQEILKKSSLFPSQYKIEGSHSLKSAMLCANMHVRGVYTSDNVYEYFNLPSDMRFKFSFDINRWEEFFDWFNLP